MLLSIIQTIVFVVIGQGDSWQREAERTNSAIGDDLVDRATIKWEHTKRFEGMNEDEIQSMSLKEYENYGKMRMQSNAWYLSKIIQHNSKCPCIK